MNRETPASSGDFMKLETKLNVSTGILVFAMFFSAATAHWRLSQVMRLSTEIGSQRAPLVGRLQVLREDVTDTVLALETSMIQGGSDSGHVTSHADRVNARQRVEEDMATLQRLDRDLDLGAEESKLSEISLQFQELVQLENDTETSVDRGGDAAVKARVELTEGVFPAAATISRATEAMIKNETALKANAIEALDGGDRAVVRTLWTATIVGAVLGSFFSLLLARRLTSAIHLVAERAAAIASGDLTGAELGVHSGDQIGALAEGMQSMQGGLAAIIGTVASTAGSLSTSAVSMRTASDQMHRRIDQQAQQTQQAATAMQEMSASIAEVSRHTQSAVETARSAAQTAREGGTIVKQMLGSMHSIASAVTETSNTVGLLGEDSKRISQIVTVIDEIARKTNLLALNAAIEAARAGDQGRGFAVVAGEVRRLAESTAQATGEIGSMIQGIQERTRTAIASMASGTGTVQEGVVTTNQAGEALERIIGMAERVDRMITQIAIAASQQATAADQSSASLDAIHILSNENLTEMSTTKAGIESLRGTVVRLEKQVDRFQVSHA